MYLDTSKTKLVTRSTNLDNCAFSAKGLWKPINNSVLQLLHQLLHCTGVHESYFDGDIMWEVTWRGDMTSFMDTLM